MNKAIIGRRNLTVSKKPLWKRILGCWPLYLMLLPAQLTEENADASTVAQRPLAAAPQG